MIRGAYPWLTLMGVVLLAPSAPAAAPPVADLRAQQAVFRAALETVTPALVRIDTIGGAQPVREIVRGDERRKLPPAFRQADGPTTGLVWAADGFIVTSSFNFVREPSIILVTLADGTQHVAELVARDRVMRLTLLKIAADGLPTLPLAPRSELQVGQWALAAGRGHGSAAPTLSVGTVSAAARMRGVALQTDASLSPANYGGPLFDIDGRVLGLCVPLSMGEDDLAGVEWYDSGIGFAVHADLVAERVERLRSIGDLTRGYIGISVDRAAPVVGAPRADDAPPGLRIVSPPAQQAHAAGLRQGDVILTVDGRPVPRVVDLQRALIGKVVGDTAELRYWRAGERSTAVVRLVNPDALTPVTPSTAPTSQRANGGVPPSEDSDETPTSQPAALE